MKPQPRVGTLKGEDDEARPPYHTHWHNHDPAAVCRWVQALVRVHARIAPRFAPAEPRRRVLAYLQGILSETERKNGWQLAEHARKGRPNGMRAYALEHLGTESAVMVIDETSFQQQEHQVG